MHELIVDAVIDCLDRFGYVETSISRVVERAGVSRGALQHYFPTKEDLMAGVAERLMHASLEHFAVVRGQRQRNVASELAAMWTRLVETRPYRALLELLHAMRTDARLRERFEPLLEDWNARFEAEALRLYCAESGTDRDVSELLVLCRCAMRGIVIQEQIHRNAAATNTLVARLIALIAPRLRARNHTPHVLTSTTTRPRAATRRR